MASLLLSLLLVEVVLLLALSLTLFTFEKNYSYYTKKIAN